MKTFLISLIIGALIFETFPASANLEVSAGINITATTDFDAPLAADGTWVDVSYYGHCWRPRDVGSDWRPYCSGHWEWTDCGWYWVSDEPWAWACYHYGYWVFDEDDGWIWVPGIEWAPAWVEWRVGDGYVGWAPLAPHGMTIAPQQFVFVGINDFTSPIRPNTVIVNNTTIVNNTKVISDISRESRTFDGQTRTVMVNKGPDVATVRKATGKNLAPVSVQTAYQQTTASAPKELRHGAGVSQNRQNSTTSGERENSREPRRQQYQEPPPQQQQQPSQDFHSENRSVPQEPKYQPPENPPRQQQKYSPQKNAPMTPSPGSAPQENRTVPQPQSPSAEKPQQQQSTPATMPHERTNPNQNYQGQGNGRDKNKEKDWNNGGGNGR